MKDIDGPAIIKDEKVTGYEDESDDDGYVTIAKTKQKLN